MCTIVMAALTSKVLRLTSCRARSLDLEGLSNRCDGEPKKKPLLEYPVKTKFLIVLVAVCILSSQINAANLWSAGECRVVSLIFLGVTAVGLSIGVPLLTVESDVLGRSVCPNEIRICTSSCPYKDCEQCKNVPVLTRCSSAHNESIYSPSCDNGAIVGCVRNDTHAEVDRVYQRNDSARAAGITFVVIGSVAGLIGLFAAASMEQANSAASQPGYAH